jgi:hypothetical protein
MTRPLHHCPQVLSVASGPLGDWAEGTPTGTSFQGSCACCGWAADQLRSEPEAALSDAYDHLARCDEMWEAA